MTYDQLNLLFAQTAQNPESGQFFYVPPVSLLFVRLVIKKTIVVVAGQPNLAVPETPGQPLDFINLLSLLGQPTNGHKLLIPAGVVRLAVTMLRKVVRRPSGALFNYDGNGNPIP